MSDVANIILSVRDKIPDPEIGSTNGSGDGHAFTFASLLRWLNDAGRAMCLAAPVIQDWYGIGSSSGMDVYELPQEICTVEQCWYDLMPLSRSTELDDIFTSKVTGNSWWFGGHSVHATPRLHIWPAPSRSALSTTLSSSINTTSTSLTLASVSGLKQMGFIMVDSELILYRTVTGNVVSNILRGQGGTLVANHNAGAPITERNVFFKCTRLPKPITSVNDPLEIPQGLWPLLELYIIASVREAEQEYAVAKGLRAEFVQAVEKLGTKAAIQPVKQGIQVRTQPPGPNLYGGRVYIP